MLIASLLFGISASLDALLVGISYGIRGTRIRLWQNLAISLVTLLGTCLFVGFGRYLAAFLPDAAGNYAGSLVLALLGLYYITKWLRSCRSCQKKLPPRPNLAEAAAPPETGIISASEAPSRKVPHLSGTEILSLSLVLSLNNLSAGFSASLAGLPLSCAAVSTFLCSVFFLFSGNRLGGSPLLQLAGLAAEPLSGALLIGLGIIQLFF